MRSAVARSGLIVAVLCLATLAFLLPTQTGGVASSAPPAPHGSAHVAPVPAAARTGPTPSTPDRAAPPRAASPPPAASCDTPSGIPIWSSGNFFSDALVTFYAPGQPSLSNSSFQIMPCSNTLPTYAHGFWLNVSTNVPITQGLVTIWGVSWPGTLSSTAIPGFDPTNVTILPMLLAPPLYHTASFYFNAYRYFWPGSTVYFNVTLISVNATPSTIYSARGGSVYSHPITYSGITSNATWTFGVQSPFSSTNFSQDIQLSTIPSITSTPVYEPNRYQTFQVIIQSVNFSGGPPVPIPAAELNVSLEQSGQIVAFSLPFSVTNHTTMSTAPFGPYPGESVQFYAVAWLPWGLTRTKIDTIVGPAYAFNWSNEGGWMYPRGEFTDNLVYQSSPSVISSSTPAVLPTGTPVNVSVAVRGAQNITIVDGNGSAQIHFLYTDASGSANGSISMTPVGLNASFGILPGLPAGGKLTFYTVVKDSFGDPIASANTTYSESGAPVPTPRPGYGIVFFEAVDLTTGALVPSLNYTISNSSWSETATGSPLGYGYPRPAGPSNEILPIAWGTYVLTVRAYGFTQTATFQLENATRSTVVFYVASGSVNPISSVPVSTYSWAAVGGVIAASVACIPIYRWFEARRKKSEEEQRRITL